MEAFIIPALSAAVSASSAAKSGQQGLQNQQQQGLGASIGGLGGPTAGTEQHPLELLWQQMQTNALGG